MLAAGLRLGRYWLAEQLGSEGSTVIWLARSPEGEQVTLHISPVPPGHEVELRHGLVADVELAQGLSHPNLVRFFDAGVDGAWQYVASEYADGLFLGPLLDELRAQNQTLSPWTAAYVAREVARALAFIHGVVDADGRPLSALHRQISPGVILLERSGGVKLAELIATGATRKVMDAVGLAQSGSIAYLSPEVLEHGLASARSDVFAVGVVLWEMLAEHPLFLRPSEDETKRAIEATIVPPLPPSTPSALADLAKSCLARDPAQRPADATALADALTRLIDGQPDASRAEVMRLVEHLVHVSEQPKKRPRTFVLSHSSQAAPEPGEDFDALADTRATPWPAKAAPAPSAPVRRPLPRGPLEAPASDVSASGAHDPFFDADRDGNTISNPRFEVLGRLGSGGMGEVYRVRDRELDEVVALKVIPRNLGAEMQSIERLKREVRLARRINSDYVCRIFDLVDLGRGARGLTMALIRGHTLAELMRTPIPVDYQRFANWAADVAEGLAAAHALNIVHRDLKPENIMITDEEHAVVLDFGIALSRAGAPQDVQGRLTQAGIIMGTPLYMSPEQLSNRDLDGRSDLYALGLILCELITKHVPINGASYSEILDRRVIKAEHYHLRDIDPDAPRPLADIIDLLLRPAAADRFDDAIQVAAALRSFAQGRTPTLPQRAAGPVRISTVEAAMEPELPPEPHPEALRAIRNERRWLAAMGTLAVTVVLLGTWLVKSTPPDADPDPPSTAGIFHLGAVDSLDAGVADTAPEPADAGPAPAPDAGKKHRRAPPPPIEM